MLRYFLAQLLCVLLVLTVPTPAQAKATDQDKEPTIQEQLVLISAGSVIEVRTKAKTKIIGKLGPLTSESFELQVAKGQSIEKQSIRFEDVKSIKKHSGMNRAWWILIGIGIGLGVLLAISAAMTRD
jgi:hypothetical protein